MRAPQVFNFFSLAGDTFEGRKMVAVVPAGLGVEQRTGLSGETSAARGRPGRNQTKPPDAKGGYWYAPATPADGWKAVPDQPDPNRTAR